MLISGKALLDLCKNYASFKENKKGGITLFRFNQAQLNMYDEGLLFSGYSKGAAGICLIFETTADSFTLKTKITRLKKMIIPWIERKGIKSFFIQTKQLAQKAKQLKGIAPVKYNFEIYVNGEKAKSIAAKDNIRFKLDNPQCEKNKIEIFFPIFCAITLKSLYAKENINAVFSDRPKLICFGDSITQGFFAQNPTGNYVYRLAELLGFDALNQGVGGFVFSPDILLEAQTLAKPDLVTVAYGTNDWRYAENYTSFITDIKAFFVRLNELYYDIPIFVITPIWRSDINEITNIGSFKQVAEVISSEASCYKNITVIDGLTLIPHEKRYFADKWLHPNEEGFSLMASRLAQEISNKINVDK